jgi:hypothetical protein
MRKRTLLAALAVTASTTVLAGAAHATVSPEDEASPVIDVTVADQAGDAHVARKARDLPERVTHSVEMEQVGYHLDRTAETLTVTYPLRRVVVSDRYRQVVATLIDPTKHTDDPGEPWAVLLSNTAKSTVRVFTFDGSGAFSQRTCKAASSVSDLESDVVTQTVPFSCLRGALDHAHLRSFAGVEATRSRRELAHDATSFTRDLPLTAYVEPTDPGTQG